MTAAPATNELRELADNVRIVALDAADYIGHANYGHRIVEAKQSIREACDELDKALRAAVTPSAQGAQPALAQLDSADARSGNLRRVVLDLLNGVTPAVENLACHQEQADADGCMVKVSRQALDEVLSAVNEVAIQAATNPSTGLLPDASPGKPAAIVTFCITGAIPGDGGACGDCDPCLMGEASMPEPVKRLIAEKNSLLQRIGELEDAVAASPDNGAEKVREHPIETAQRGFDAWAAKEHNKKWFKRIDGTPIPNDLVVCIAMEFAALHSTSAAGETTSSDGGVEGHAATPIWVSADRKVDATSCSIQEGSQSGLAGIKPGPSEAIPADVLAMKEACRRLVLDAKAREVEVFDAANRDMALSDTGRQSIQDRALARDSILRDIAAAISRIPVPPSPVQDEAVAWTPELEKARIELCEFWIGVADGSTLSDKVKAKAIETEAALTILGDIVSRTPAKADAGEIDVPGKTAGEAVAVKVKPLVWRDHRPDSFPEPAWSAATPFGFYHIEEVSASDSPAYVVRLHAHHFIADKDGLDAAKAAAQADYETRIRSALDTEAQDVAVSIDDLVSFIKDKAYTTFDDWEDDFARALLDKYSIRSAMISEGSR